MRIDEISKKKKKKANRISSLSRKENIKLMLKAKEQHKKNQEEPEKEFQKAIELIKANCQPWLKETNGNLFYRGDYALSPLKGGYRREEKFFVKIKPRKKREPVDSTQLQQIFYNTLFPPEANRDNSYFITSNPLEAESYGPVGYFFPIGNYHYSYTNFRDLYSRFGEDNPYLLNILDIKKLRKYILQNKELFSNDHDLYMDSTDDFIDVLESIHSWIFHDSAKKMFKFLQPFISKTKLKEKIQITNNKNLLYAHKEKKEVMINPINGAILLSTNFPKHKVLNALRSK